MDNNKLERLRKINLIVYCVYIGYTIVSIPILSSLSSTSKGAVLLILLGVVQTIATIAIMVLSPLYLFRFRKSYEALKPLNTLSLISFFLMIIGVIVLLSVKINDFTIVVLVTAVAALFCIGNLAFLILSKKYIKVDKTANEQPIRKNLAKYIGIGLVVVAGLFFLEAITMQVAFPVEGFGSGRAVNNLGQMSKRQNLLLVGGVLLLVGVFVFYKAKESSRRNVLTSPIIKRAYWKDLLEASEIAEFKGNIEEAIDKYLEVLYHLQKPYQELGFEDNEQRNLKISAIEEKIALLKTSK